MTGGGVGELDVSADGSRVVVGKRISTDAKGNEFWHLYMHVGNSPNSIDLTPGITTGVLFDGMSEDGSKVFFTSKDNLFGDSDSSADIFETAVSPGGSASTRLITTKGGVPSNTDACAPSNEPDSWNAVTGEGKCNAVAFAGAAGIAAEAGTFYFLSPEQLDGGNGLQNQANLYVVKPGGNPEFVTTMDSSVGKEVAPPPDHPVVKAKFASSLAEPTSLSVDQASGDLYVAESGSGAISRFNSAGAPDNFTAGPNAGTNKLTGFSLPATESQIAVDSAPTSPLKGALYVTSNGGSIYVYASSGEKLGELTGFGEACGVSVDQSNGDVYVGDYSYGGVRRFHPTSGAGPISNASYGPETSINTEGLSPCKVEADSAGHVYARDYFTEVVKQYPDSQFATTPPVIDGSIASGTATALQSDAENGDLYVDEGGQLARYSAAGVLIQKFGSGAIASSKGVAINAASKHVYATSGANIVEFGVAEAPFRPIASPAVLHGSEQSGVHSFGDFQVTPDGRYAAFASTQPVTGYPSFGYYEIYRYDTADGALACASCSPTLGAPSNDATLLGHGLNLTDGGKIFYTTRESLALRDTNEKLDAYEWSNGVVQLISTGISGSDSGMVTASADGKNAFFFTRDVLTSKDENGNTVKIYDARQNGGVVQDPPRKLCAASDECHGPGTEEPAPPGINTVTGSGPAAGSKPAACKRGFVKKHGKCVKKKHKKHHMKKSRARRNRR
jgi:hypothetical protein